jgi:hypothetical protein
MFSLFSFLSLIFLSLPTSISSVEVTLTFGADFSQNANSQFFVQGGYTVVDNANFITGLEGNVGTLSSVQWRFDMPPSQLPPTSALVKVLTQSPTEPWRFQLVEERLITVRVPNAVEIAADDAEALLGGFPSKNGYGAQTYTDEIKNFWQNPILLDSLPAGYSLTIPGVPGPAAAPAVFEFQFVGFYFPDQVSQVAAYETDPITGTIEWAMPGNFDWTSQYSPQARFEFLAGTSGSGFDNPANQIPIVGPVQFSNVDGSVVPGWRQYRKLSLPADQTNFERGYLNPTLNAQRWVEGFLARKNHKDFFKFTVTYNRGSLVADPQFSGFQGQNFQFHGMADEVFNLISTPTFQLNGNFRYLSTGQCNYNDTTCWSHPGTYVDQLGFLLGDIRIKAIAGPHDLGLQLYMNDIQIHLQHHQRSHNKIIFAIGNSSRETGSIEYVHRGRVVVDTPMFNIAIHNADYFFNMEVIYKDHEVLRAGKKSVKLRELYLCSNDGMKSEDRMKRVEQRMNQFYPHVPLHGLIGQTWRNAQICDHAWVGDASDYVTSDLFATDSAFNYYGTPQ